MQNYQYFTALFLHPDLGAYAGETVNLGRPPSSLFYLGCRFSQGYLQSRGDLRQDCNRQSRLSEQDLVADEESTMVCFIFIFLQFLMKKLFPFTINYYAILSVSFQNVDLLFFYRIVLLSWAS